MWFVASPTESVQNTFEQDIETHRRELTAYCYRMLGSGSEAEDAVQDTFLRAWRKQDTFEGRSSLRSWLYRIATNVCLDMLQGSQRRARPMDLNAPVTADTALDAGLPQESWVLPIADGRVLSSGGDPAELTAERETIRLAFVAALQHLPPKQRAVLILREVLRWKADEVAELLETTTASVNSALQRARATLDEANVDAEATAPKVGADDEELLARYVDAFERYDIASLVALIHEDATFSMPPWELWLRGPEDVGKWMLGTGIGCKGSKLRVTRANGRPAVAVFKPSEDEPGMWTAFNLCVLDFEDGKITAIHNFIFPELFPTFGLPMQVEG
jgi:RNA polymerase sigma-70 factor (ECF subfamily)